MIKQINFAVIVFFGMLFKVVSRYDTNVLPAFAENSSFSATLDFKEACMKSLNSG
jgi:hypothetical protein